MSDQEPNNLPPAPVTTNTDNTASYSKRFLAFVIDLFLLAMALAFLARYLGLEPTNTVDLVVAQKEFAEKFAALPQSTQILFAFSPYIIFFVFHGLLLFQYGQTIGKRILGIAIVTLENQKPAFIQLIFQRYLPQWLVSMVQLGMILRLVDILMVFRKDKRCLHDLIARTKVIDLRIKIAATPNSFIA